MPRRIKQRPLNFPATLCIKTDWDMKNRINALGEERNLSAGEIARLLIKLGLEHFQSPQTTEG